MCSLDLKDAYLAVPITLEHRKYLRFLWSGRIFEFTCPPVWPLQCPRVFMKLLCSVMGYLHSEGLRTVNHLDEILVLF